MLNFNSCNKSFSKLKVLNNINLRINEGEAVAIAGPNGSGKSTLMKSIMGLVNVDSGTIEYRGQNINKDFIYRQEIGYMPQIGRYPDNLTPEEIFNFIAKIRNRSDLIKYQNLIEEFELTPHLNKKMRTLSGGTRQKVSVLIASMFNPSLYILDEPTTGLDPKSSKKFKELVKSENNSGKTILLVTHIMSEIEAIAERIIFLIDGVIKIDNNIEQIKKETNEKNLENAIYKLI